MTTTDERMNQLALSFRDSAMAVIPGLFLFVAIAIWLPDTAPTDPLATLVAGVAGLAALYGLGVVFHGALNIVLRNYVRRSWNRQFGDVEDTIGAVWDEQPALARRVDERLKQHLGEDVVAEMGPASKVYTMVRYIELKNERVSGGMERMISLDNLCYALVLPLGLLSLSAAGRTLHSLLTGSGAPALLFLLMAVVAFGGMLLCPYAGERYRSWLSLTAARYYLLLTSDQER